MTVHIEQNGSHYGEYTVTATDEEGRHHVAQVAQQAQPLGDEYAEYRYYVVVHNGKAHFTTVRSGEMGVGHDFTGAVEVAARIQFERAGVVIA